MPYTIVLCPTVLHPRTRRAAREEDSHGMVDFNPDASNEQFYRSIKATINMRQ